MKTKILPLFTIIILALTSCATIFYGNKGVVTFKSDPPGAEIIIDGKKTNKTTPAEIDIVKEKYVKPRIKFGSLPNVRYQLKKENYVEAIDIIEGRINYVAYLDFFIPPSMNRSAQFRTEINKKLLPSQVVIISDTIVKQETVFKTDTLVKQEIVYVESESGKPQYTFEKKSHVDRNIPKRAAENRLRFALIIGNEDYSSRQIDLSTEIDVHYARNDASAFKEYAINVFGVPERNITFLLDATTGQMNQAISKMQAIIRSTQGEAEVYVYYAGHGLPDEVSREAYLIPVDVSGRNAKDGINLTQMYHTLTEYPSKHVTVFIDACFSGGAREQGLLAARGVRVRPRENVPKGNLVVFAASSGDQSALPYNDEHHGFFTYHLLKILKEKSGSISYGDLADYLKSVVPLESILVNEKDQTPQINVSPSIGDNWESIIFF